MKLKITWSNSGGELDSRIVEGSDEDVEVFAAMAVDEMVDEGGGKLSPGDVITVTEA